MSWQVGSFSILAVALAGGFAWYERTRPDARIVALVATLAAFAALGRIAFAALPNVKPTTDIVLVSGYALGGAPGFVVGAVAGLTSNFFFGQGPWTPWQMAAWGATGLIGAGAARVTKGRISRWPLAVLCAVVGYAFTVLQDVGDWVTYSDHSLTQLGIYVGKGTGFDAVHAVGCLLFALAFGPALTRSIARFARRLSVVWETASGPALPVALIACAAGLFSLASPSGARAATPTGYLLGAQNSDGGYGPAPGQSSSELYAGWAALGLEAEGYNPQSVSNGGSSLLAYIQSGAGSMSDPGSVERTILVASAAGVDPNSFGGQNLVAELQADIRGDGSVSEQVNLTAFAVLALRAAGVSPPGDMLSWLAAQQDSDGGFNFATAGGSSDVDDTGAALQALADGGAWGHELARAVAFIRGQQNPDGGFPADPGESSNAQSTAWAVQGLDAVGVDPGSMPHGSPVQYLQGLIAADGHVQYSQSNNQTPVWVTAEAAMALAGKPLPLAPVGGGGSGGRGPHGRGHGGARSGSGALGNQQPSRAAARRRRAARVFLLGFGADAGLGTVLLLAPAGAS